MNVHRAAAVGFERAADAYEDARPGYPEQAMRWLAGELGLAAGSVVVDLAAGTGKLTRELVRTGAHVIAVEPVTAMRTLLVESCPQAEVVDGTAEELPLPAASADAVTVAQAFHWFDGERALAAIDRVLRPTGKLALIYNLRDMRQPLQNELENLLAPHRGSTPSHRSHWRDAFAATGLFQLASSQGFHQVHQLSADGLVSWVGSISFIASLPDAERRPLLDEVRTLAPDGRVALEYDTEISIYEKPGS